MSTCSPTMLGTSGLKKGNGSSFSPTSLCAEKPAKYDQNPTCFRRVSVKQFMERINTDTLHFLYPYIRLQAALALPLGELSPQVTERAL